jgi:hypothetical protein
VFGLGEIRKREFGERDIKEKSPISHVWFEEKWKREKSKTWVPHHFNFSSRERRKRRELAIYLNFTFLPISLWLCK